MAGDLGLGSIVIVDDEADISENLKEHFAAKGASNVRTFSSADEAFNYFLKQVAEAKLPNLLITDFKMPKTTGLDLIKKMKANHALKDIPIIMMTAHGEEEVVRAAGKMGVTDFIAKPFKMEFVQKRVETLMLKQLLRSGK